MMNCIETVEMPDWLWDFEYFDIQKVLKDSLYYPACCVDAFPIKQLMGNTYSFVYVDHWVEESKLLEHIYDKGFKGYKLIFTRNIDKEELTPNGWNVYIPPKDEYVEHEGIGANERNLNSGRFPNAKPYCRWFIFERTPDYDESHNPKRFSLLYLSSDGAAAYQALYLSNRTKPKFLCLINPGMGTDYHCERSLMARSVRHFYSQTGNDDYLPKYLVTHYAKGRFNWSLYPYEIVNFTTLKLDTHNPKYINSRKQY